MKQLFFILTISCLALFGMTTTASAATYEVSNCTQLQTAADNATTSLDIVNINADIDNDCTAIFGNDSEAPFRGTFNGNGNMITFPENSLPLFRYVADATIQDITVTGTVRLLTEDPYGPLGSFVSGGVYDNVVSSVNIVSANVGINQYGVGGFIGVVADASSPLYIRGSEFNGSITIEDILGSYIAIGGLIGNIDETVINNPVYVTSTIISGIIDVNVLNVIGIGSVVGMVGRIGEGVNPIGSNIVIEQVTSTVDMTIETHSDGIFGGNGYFGGLIGVSSVDGILQIDSAVYSGDIMVSSTYNVIGLAGIVGVHAGSGTNNVIIDTVEHTGNITVVNNSGNTFAIGGIFGALFGVGELSIDTSYAEGDITLTASSTTQIGGLIGLANFVEDIIIQSSYTTGDIVITSDENVSQVGGMIGGVEQTNITFESSYATGSITVSAEAVSYIGGLLGQQDGGDLSIESSYATVNNIINAVYEADRIGGLIGYVDGTSVSITSTYANGSISIADVDDVGYVGGLVGELSVAEDIYFYQVYAIVDIDITNDNETYYEVSYIGGFIGDVDFGSESTISNVFSDGTIDIIYTSPSSTDYGITQVGGFAGDISTDGFDEEINNIFTVEYSYSATDITISTLDSIPLSEIGGFIGDDSDGALRLNDIFVAGSLDISSVSSDNIGAVFGRSLEESGLSNVYVDVARVGYDNCEYDVPNKSGCNLVNTSGGDSDYFINNTTNAPLDNWNFDAIWNTKPSFFPVFIFSDYDGEVEETIVEEETPEPTSRGGGSTYVPNPPFVSPSANINISPKDSEGVSVSGAFAINGGAAQTTMAAVTLNFTDIENVTQVAISESQSFAGVNYQTFSSSMPFTLTSGNGTKTVYAKLRSVEGSTLTLKDSIVLGGTTSTPISPAQGLQCTSNVYLTNAVKLGANNNAADVRLLEEFLNTYENAKLTVNGVYEQVDFDAVVRWQEKYAADILTPWGLTKGTGYVYTNSLKKIKAIHEANCATAAPAPLAPAVTTAGTTACLNTTDTLRLGMNNPSVATAQRLLKKLGHYRADIDTTGYFGTVTETATRAFQGANGIDQVGFIGPQTRTRLNELGCSL